VTRGQGVSVAISRLTGRQGAALRFHFAGRIVALSATCHVMTPRSLLTVHKHYYE